MIYWLHQQCENFIEDGSGLMRVSRGRVQKCLGMTLDYTIHGQVNISLFDYIDEIIIAFNKVEPMGGGRKKNKMLLPTISSRSMKTARSSSLKKP
jgi:hypothetical protein